MITAMNLLYQSPMFPAFGSFFNSIFLFSNMSAVNDGAISAIHLRLLGNVYYQSYSLFIRCRLLRVAIGRLFSAIYFFICYPYERAVLYAQSVLSFIRVPLSSSNINLSFNYTNSSATTNPLPIMANRVALPSKLAAIPLLNVLPQPLRDLYAGPSPKLIRDSVQVGVMKRDLKPPMVFGSRSEYKKLLKRLWDLGMIGFITNPISINGMFTVYKDESTDRLIIDAQPANVEFLDPPSVLLPDPSYFIKVQSPPNTSIYMAKADLSNFYHHMLLPEWMRPYFSLPYITAKELSTMGIHMGSNAKKYYPCCHTLPMGFSHAVFIAQSVHEFILLQCGFNFRQSVLSPYNSIYVGPIFAIYIDDLVIIGINIDIVNAMLSQALSGYQLFGFPIAAKKIRFASNDFEQLRSQEMLGMVLDGVTGTLYPSPSKFVSLLVETLFILTVPVVSGHVLQHIVGSWAWFILLRRPMFSFLHDIYRFITVSNGRDFTLWPSARNELISLMALSPMLTASLWSSNYSKLLATDASLQKQALVVTPMPQSGIIELLSLANNKPSTMMPNNAPSSLIDCVHTPTQSVTNVFQPSIPFITIPPQHDFIYSQVSRNAWSTIISAPFRYHHHINKLELQAVVSAIRWVLSSPTGLHTRIICFIDNPVTALIIKKGRARSRSLQSLMRKLSLYLIAADLQINPIWVPSAINPADRPSRS